MSTFHELEQQLNARLEQGHLPQAFVILGSAGLGKSTLGRRLIQRSFCQARPVDRPCESCTECRQVANLRHPNLMVLDGRKEPLSVAAVAPIGEFLSISPQPSTSTQNIPAKRWVFIQQASSLNAAAINKLLKIVEEPPDFGQFIFTAERLMDLSLTLRSRVVKFELTPLAQEGFESWLRQEGHEVDAYQASWLHAISGGSPGRALELLYIFSSAGWGEWLAGLETLVGHGDPQEKSQAILKLSNTLGQLERKQSAGQILYDSLVVACNRHYRRQIARDDRPQPSHQIWRESLKTLDLLRRQGISINIRLFLERLLVSH